MTEILAVEDLTVRLPGAGAVVDGLDFRVQSGAVTALVGESGSGKSVTAMSVLGLLPKNAEVTGSIRLAGEELTDASPLRLRELRGTSMGAVFQEPMSAWNPVLRIGDQLAEAFTAHQRTGSVPELLPRVGLGDPDRILRSYPHELSGGQLQRAMIAMAIANQPRLLIADEPTTALDVTVQAEILDLLRELADDRDIGILLITHDMGVVADLASDVVVLRDGHLVEAEPVAQLFARPRQSYTRELLAAVPTFGGSAPPQVPRGDHPVAQTTALSASFASRHGAVDALSEVSIEIGPGEVLGLVGESGSGKSTLGKALVGLVRPKSGTVALNGKDLSRLSGRALRNQRARVGMIFQDPAGSLNPRHPIGTSIAEPLKLAGMSDHDVGKRVGELLDSVQLPPELAERLPWQLSGGQRQRVAIARAIAGRPELIIADEPTSALDVTVQEAMLELLAELRGAYGFGCLFISHDLAVVSQVAHRVAVLRGGRIVEQGPVAQVLGGPSTDYTRQLLAAVPVADPKQQQQRRAQRRQLGRAS